MQWRRQRKITHVIGSSNHVLLLARYQDAPPGEEDEEEGLRKDYVKSQEKETNTHTHFDRNEQQGGYKPRRAGTSTSGGSTSGYASSGSRSHRDESAGSPSQPKIIFNEEEYTKIMTPRQDVLFKKGYLSRKKPWTGNASTSATPSTTESQSASHSTADGSETTEDQQLLDRDSGTGEYPPMAEPGAQLGYGAFYDHASGYYYEYPVMLVGPAPVPTQVGPSVLATVPCGPVPLRPIEWINPAFVPKLASQPYCLMDYQTNQSTEVPVAIVEEQNAMIAEASNSVWNEGGTGSASCNGSATGEIEKPAEEEDNVTMEQHAVKEQLAEEQPSEQLHLEGQQHLENGMTTVDPYLDPLMMQEPVHMMPAVPQPYMYPGHYMFGPPLVNVNGVTIQGGPLVRTMDITAMTMAYAKRRKKRKKRKQRRLTLGNTEDEEEGEYSSEYDVSSSRPWSECPISTATTTMTTANQPLNPECQEFQLPPALQSRIFSGSISTSNVVTMTEEITSSVNDAPDMSSYTETESANCETETSNSSTAQSLTNQEETTIHDLEQVIRETSLDNTQSSTIEHMSRNSDAEINSQANCLVVNVETIVANETTEIWSSAPTDHETPSRTDITLENGGDSTSANAKHESFENNSNDINMDTLSNRAKCPEESLTNGDTNHEHLTDLTEKASKSRSVSPQNSDSNLTAMNINETEEVQRLRYCNNSSITRATSLGLPRKYNKKGLKFVRESTPGPDLDESTHLDVENRMLVQQLEAVELSDVDCKCSVANDELGEMERKVTSEEDAAEVRNDSTINATSRDMIEGSNEDSGFESQTRLSKKYPITAAVKEWLRRANSPDLFITSASTSESETDDDEEMDVKPPKNLQGNPMPALSANSGVDNVMLLSRTASCGEFAKTNNNNINNNNAKNDQEADTTSIGRRKRDAKVVKRKTMAKRNDKRNRNADEKTQSQLVSSLVSLDFVTAMRSRDKPKNNVGDVCEFTQEDSVAGMRVALSSRINSKRVNARRMKTLRKISKNPVENIDIKMRRIDNLNDEKGKEANEDRMVSVRTFEKGEIIVSQDGRLLLTSSYEPVAFNDYGNPIAKTAAHVDVINKNVEMCEKIRNSSDENDSVMIASSVSIEEPDVLECWEVETVEPVITPRKMMQSPGVLCEGEAAEDDNTEVKKAIAEHVRTYYRFARDTVNTEEESSEFSTSVISSRTVPNDPEDKTIGYFHDEEIPIFTPDKNQDVTTDEKIPIDEAFEVYENYYNGKSPFLSFDSMLGQRPFYGQNGEGPIPCRAVCCNIQ